MCGLGFEVIVGLAQGQSRVLRNMFNDAGGEACGGVNTGANSGASQGQLSQARQCCFHALNALRDLGGVAGEFLSEGDRRGIHQVGASRLDDVFKFNGLRGEGIVQGVQAGQENVNNSSVCGDVDR